MNETEFLDLLRYYFRNAKTEEVEEILADYESHFEEGKREAFRRKKSPESLAVRRISTIPSSPKEWWMKRPKAAR